MQYLDWLSCVVVVPKNNGKKGVCVDYSYLNDAYPKDNFPLPWINHIVDATVRYELLSFMDPYSSYNHIPMFTLDSLKTTFITLTEMYYYNVMSFGLKNTRATYQCMMSLIFEPLLGKTIEAYIDDMLVKSTSHVDHLPQLREASKLMRQH